MRFALALLSFGTLSVACAPRVVQDYAVRNGEVVFAVQDGNSYQMGDCKRTSDGKLTDCKLYEVEFD
jgi:hypothetical protein